MFDTNRPYIVPSFCALCITTIIHDRAKLNFYWQFLQIQYRNSHRDGVDMKIGRQFLSLINVIHIAKMNIAPIEGTKQPKKLCHSEQCNYVIVSQANDSNFIFMGIYFIRQINNSFIYK